MMNENSIYCVYMTPCNYCSKFDKWCDKNCNGNKTESVVYKETTEKMLNHAGEYAVKFAKNHGISVAEAMEKSMVKARFDVFNETGR